MASSKTTTIIFVHGFMGSEGTFNSLPNDLVEFLKGATSTHLVTKLFSYDSNGNDKAEKLYDFINSQPDGDCHIVSHSMGGILGLDCLRLKDRAPLSKLKGVISIDTPYWGLSLDVSNLGSHSSLVPEPIKKFASSASNSGWGFFAAATAVVAAGVLASSSDLQDKLKEKLESTKEYVGSTLDFLAPLRQIDDMDIRFNVLKDRPDLYFSGIYLKLKDGTTFTRLPQSEFQQHFQAFRMNRPTSVVDAHMHLFDAEKDADAYSEMMLMIMQRLKESISKCSLK